jgi:hypothetical protein
MVQTRASSKNGTVIAQEKFQDNKDERLPMASVMRLYFHSHFESFVSKKGAPPTTLPALIHRDLLSVGRKFNSAEDYKEIKGQILNEKEWLRMVDSIASKASMRMFEQAASVGRKRKAKNREHDEEDLRTGNIPESMRGEDLAEPQQVTEPPAHGSSLDSNDEVVHTPVDIDLTLSIPRRIRKRKPALIPVPDNIPVSKRLKQRDSELADISENTERNARLVEGLNVNNGVMRGRTF